MKFLLDFVACCGSSPSGTTRPMEDTRLLAMQETRRRVPRRNATARGGSSHEWRPSLSSISEDVLAAEKTPDVQRPADGWYWHRSIKRKVASVSQRDRPRTSDHYDCRISSVMPTFSPVPFLF